MQVHKLFLRTVNIFPPHGLDVGDNFFSLQRSPSEEHPGRVYIGICATGRRLKAALIRVYTAFLCSAQALVMRWARTGPMPVTSRKRSGSASITSNTVSPKARTSFCA